MSRLGFIGLGVMGRHMAASLLTAGHALAVHDLRREAGRALEAKGARWADDPAAAARGAEAVFTSLPGPAEVEAVAERLVPALASGAAWFELSTNSPDVVRRLAARCAERGAQLLDAPVSGGPAGAAARKLAIMVGGDQPTFARHRALLEAIGDAPFYVGPVGAGTVAKLAHNTATFSVMTALAEVFTLGVKAGVEPLALFRALRQGASGRKRTFDRLAEQFFGAAYDPPAFTLRLGHKDLSLALALARSCGVPMRAAEHALSEMEQAMARGWGERDVRVPMALQEERAGVAVRIAPEALRAELG